jgi:hypothetical protein
LYFLRQYSVLAPQFFIASLIVASLSPHKRTC